METATVMCEKLIIKDKELEITFGENDRMENVGLLIFIIGGKEHKFRRVKDV